MRKVGTGQRHLRKLALGSGRLGSRAEMMVAACAERGRERDTQAKGERARAREGEREKERERRGKKKEKERERERGKNRGAEVRLEGVR